LIIDATHKRWMWTTLALALISLGAYGWLNWITPGGLTGGTTGGLAFGILGSALMVYAGLLSALRKVPAWSWLGARQTWMRGHIWLGSLSAVLILCHSGFRWGGWLEWVLWLVLAGVLATGVFGLILQQLLPRMITIRITREGPYEQIPHLCRTLIRQADELVQSSWNVADPDGQMSIVGTQMGPMARAQLQEFYDQRLRPYLLDPAQRTSPLANPMKARAAFSRLRLLPGLTPVHEHINKLESIYDECHQLAAQDRLHRWLHVWLLVHIPLSVALLVLGVVHAVMSLYY
jgi:hypothetical protein